MNDFKEKYQSTTQAFESYSNTAKEFFSLEGNASKKSVLECGKKLYAAYKGLNQEVMLERLDIFDISRIKLKNVIDEVQPIIAQVERIPKATLGEKNFLGMVRTYLLQVILMHSKYYEYVSTFTMTIDPASKSLEKLSKFNKLILVSGVVSASSVIFTLAGLFPLISIPAAIISIGIFSWEKFMSEKEISNLRAMAREVEYEAMPELESLKIELANLRLVAEFVSEVNHEMDHEIIGTLEKIESGDRISLSEIAKLSKKLTSFSTNFNNALIPDLKSYD